MDTAEIEVFLTLAEELHFGHTADRLRLPQPQVSRLVARLERRAGGALFDRTSRRVRLTPLGEQLRTRLQPVYTEIAAALEEARAASHGITGVLRVGFTVTTGGETLTRLVAAFEARHGECRVALCEHALDAESWDVWAPLWRGESDVLVDWLAVDEPGLTAGPAIEYRLRVLAVGRGHRLAACAAVSAEELATEQVCELPPSFPRAQDDMLIPRRTPSGRPVVRTGPPIQSFHELLTLTARGQIVHPTVTGVALFARDDIVLVPIHDLPPIPLGLIWCTSHENARIRALADTAAVLAPSRDSQQARPGPGI